MKGTPSKGIVCLAVVLVALLFFSGLPMKATSEGTRGDQVILVVGGQDKMKTRNPLPSIANDVWTSDVLGRIYDSVGQALPNTEELVPYIIKGIDVNEDGTFQTSEYGKFAKAVGTDPLRVIAYYDFNGIYFHDGIQADCGDLLFSYQLQALNSRMNIDLRVLMDKAGKSGSNYTTTRWLFMTPTTKTWENEASLGGVSSLRCAIRFELQEPFALFYRSTLTGYTLYPRHLWEGTGMRGDISSPGCSLAAPCEITNIHPNFGKAIYPESDSKFGQGIPTTDPQHFVYNKPETPEADSAEEWRPSDNEVIGTGPFMFDSFDETSGSAVVLKNPLFYTGVDPKTGATLDSFVASYIHQPYIDGILTRVYASATLGILALQSGEIDFYHWSLAPEFVPPLLNNPNIRIWNRPEPGFFYLAYNMRRQSIGMYNWGQANQFDVGLHFRRAVAHLIDKPTIVKNFLQNYGVPGVVPLNPDNVRFYNASLTGYSYSRALAQQEIDLAHQDALILKAQLGSSAPAGIDDWYTYDGNGRLILPGIGTSEFNLWCPNADYDPVRANSCSMVATEMRNMGIQVVARPTAFSSIIQLINAHDFDMYILGWRIGGNDPDYFYSFFHSSNAAAGQNYGGFTDSTFDYIVEETRKELDEAKRIWLFQWAQGILSQKLPYDVLYFRTNIEAQRQDRFVDWMPSSGTIWNYWSLMNIKPPSSNRLSVGIEIPSAMASDDTKPLKVTVKDQDGVPLNGANITLEITPADSGKFVYPNGTEDDTYLGRTTSAGLLLNYHAPTVNSTLNVTISASVEYPDFPDAGRSALVTVYPGGVNFLAVTLQLIDTDVVSAEESLRFGIRITTQAGFEKPDATVDVIVEPGLNPPYGADPSSGTASEMQQITFRAPPISDLGFDENPFTLTVTASSPSFNQGSTSIGLIVIKPYKTCPDGSRITTDKECPSQGLPALEVVITLAVIGSMAATYAVVRRRKD